MCLSCLVLCVHVTECIPCHSVTTHVTLSLHMSLCHCTCHSVTAASTGVLSVSFSPSGAHLVVGCERGLVKVYANSDFKPLFELQEQKVRSAGCEVCFVSCILVPPSPPSPRVISPAWHTLRMESGWPVVPQMGPSACGGVSPCNYWQQQFFQPLHSCLHPLCSVTLWEPLAASAPGSRSHNRCTCTH